MSVSVSIKARLEAGENARKARELKQRQEREIAVQQWKVSEKERAIKFEREKPDIEQKFRAQRERRLQNELEAKQKRQQRMEKYKKEQEELVPIIANERERCSKLILENINKRKQERVSREQKARAERLASVESWRKQEDSVIKTLKTATEKEAALDRLRNKCRSEAAKRREEWLQAERKKKDIEFAKVLKGYMDSKKPVEIKKEPKAAIDPAKAKAEAKVAVAKLPERISSLNSQRIAREKEFHENMSKQLGEYLAEEQARAAAMVTYKEQMRNVILDRRESLRLNQKQLQGEEKEQLKKSMEEYLIESKIKQEKEEAMNEEKQKHLESKFHELNERRKAKEVAIRRNREAKLR
mmetsp:Transcript_39084/g.63130  ORF Transcript_39084/g.63130 Transcript_39084/m.63130 type:complete len:355 (-) Transcript_39084:2014-3078(-)